MLIEALKLGNEVTKTDIPLDTLYSNKLVGEYNKFDADAVARQAREH